MHLNRCVVSGPTDRSFVVKIAFLWLDADLRAIVNCGSDRASQAWLC